MSRPRLAFHNWPAAVYAIGDVHGCLDQLVALEAVIAEDGLNFEGEKWLVTVGDHVDRGPDSAGVIAHVMGPAPKGFRRFALIGRIHLEKLGWLTLSIGLLFILVAITLIHNTIRLAIYSNRFLIKNQELVGASWNFIARPYLWRGLKNGLWAAFLAIGGLLLLRFWSVRQLPALADLENWPATIAIFIGLMLLGLTSCENAMGSTL